MPTVASAAGALTIATCAPLPGKRTSKTPAFTRRACGAPPAQLKRAAIIGFALVNWSPRLAIPFAGSPFTTM